MPTGIPTSVQAVIDAIRTATPEIDPVDLRDATAELGQVTVLLDAIAPILSDLKTRAAVAEQTILELTPNGGKDGFGHMRNVPVAGVGMFHRENKESAGRPKYKELYEYLFEHATPAIKGQATRKLARMKATITRTEKLVRGEAPEKTTKKGWTGPKVQPETQLIAAENAALVNAGLAAVVES